MKRHHLIPTLAALTLAFALPALAATTTAQNATASKSGTTAKSTSATKSTSAKKSTAHHTSSSSKKTHKIDVNTASREELMTLPGVTGDMADKIIAARPYKNMSELESKNVVTKAEYNKIKGHITTAKPAEKHAEAPAQGNTGAASQNASSSDQTTPTDQTTK